MLAITVAVVVTAVALNLSSDTRNGTTVDTYGPPPAEHSPAPSISASTPATRSPGTVLATIALKNTATPGNHVGAAAPGDSPDTIPAPAACDGSAYSQQWRVVDIGGDRVVGDPMQLRPCAYQQRDSAPYPEDQAFLLKTHQDKTFKLVCRDDKEIRFALDKALGN